ncbi:E3 ubiquitin-protein ligase RNF170-like [Salvia hispanica]|uniref:E3 ubiquitin-protein ligase RNF170-like n=1 Tax=Salvia hispanica TaxID=49212 RepID=UPI0020095D38|nr:E3 ubiquitin-protein ligase RNF170-like [Salvia hispanica]XP_047975052.1 E3 ubiquitin-protein ligase RNF170-like [Salvia hispanica]
MDGPPVNDECSICQQNFQIPCQANCGHWFCGRCILQVWDFGHALRPCKCPLCRREITLLVPSEAHRTADGAEILQRIEHYNRQFGAHPNSLMQRMYDLPFLLRRLTRDIMDPQRALPLVVRARVYLAMILSAMYVLSPVDIIPEALLGIIGLLDDLIVVFMCFLYVAALYRTVLVSRHGGA